MDTKKAERVVSLGIAAVMVLVWAGMRLVQNTSVGPDTEPLLSDTVAIQVPAVLAALVVAAVFGFSWKFGKFLWLPVVLMVPGLVLIAPIFMAVMAAIFFGAVTVAYLAGLALNSADQNEALWRNQNRLVLPVVLGAGALVAMYGFSGVPSWDEGVISAMHTFPIAMFLVLIGVAAFVAGKRHEIPVPAFTAIAVMFAAHYVVDGMRLPVEEFAAIAVAVLAYVAGRFIVSGQQRQNTPAASSRETVSSSN